MSMWLGYVGEALQAADHDVYTCRFGGLPEFFEECAPEVIAEKPTAAVDRTEDDRIISAEAVDEDGFATVGKKKPKGSAGNAGQQSKAPTTPWNRCHLCHREMTFVCQLYAPQEGRKTYAHRLMHVLACRHGCAQKNRGWKVLRSVVEDANYCRTEITTVVDQQPEADDDGEDAAWGVSADDDDEGWGSSSFFGKSSKSAADDGWGEPTDGGLFGSSKPSSGGGLLGAAVSDSTKEPEEESFAATKGSSSTSSVLFGSQSAVFSAKGDLFGGAETGDAASDISSLSPTGFPGKFGSVVETQESSSAYEVGIPTTCAKAAEVDSAWPIYHLPMAAEPDGSSKLQKKELARAQELYEKYKRDEASGALAELDAKTHTAQKGETTDENDDGDDSDPEMAAFENFQNRVDRSPEQVIRYTAAWKNADLLRMSAKKIDVVDRKKEGKFPIRSKKGDPGVCAHCGADRTFEFSLLPTLLWQMQSRMRKSEYKGYDFDKFDFGAVHFFVCSADCNVTHATEECVAVEEAI